MRVALLFYTGLSRGDLSGRLRRWDLDHIEPKAFQRSDL